MTFVFSALLEYALVNYASRSDAQRLARRKHQKQYDIDRGGAFDPDNMEDAVAAAAANNGGGAFAMVGKYIFQCIDILIQQLFRINEENCNMSFFTTILETNDEKVSK